MIDPFAIQTPSGGEGVKPVHDHAHRFLFKKRRGHILDDYTVSEGKTPYLGVSTNQTMFRLFLIVVLVIFGTFIARAAYLQLFQGTYYRTVAEGNRIRLEPLPATRGLIFDRWGKLLVENIPQFTLTVRPSDFPKLSEDRDRLFSILKSYNISKDEILDVVETHQRSEEWLPLREGLPREQAIELMAELNNVPGISVRLETRRLYNNQEAKSLSHILGYMGKPSSEDIETGATDNRSQSLGKLGLEEQYEDVLRGVNGKKQIEVDAFGNEKEIIAQENPKNGTHLVLTIDAELQSRAETILTNMLKATKKERGAVVMMDPRDGSVRALVSWPSFDANDFGEGLSAADYQSLVEDENQPLFPRAMAGTYPSGSTIKTVFSVGALEDGIITPSTTVNSVGGIGIGQWFFPDWKPGGHGPTNVYKAIAESVNTFYYYIGGGYGNFEGLGPNRLSLWAKRFGLGALTGIDIPGESAGFIPTVDWKERERQEPWYIGDTYHFAIGQGDVLVTPIQLATVAATIANGGTQYEPHLISKYRDPNGEEVKWEPQIRDQGFASAENLQVVKEAMRYAVTSETGGARSLQLVPVAVSGKTGTAQWHSEKSPHSWFMGFAPFDNPTISIAVLIEEGGSDRGSTALPVAREILTWYFSNRDE